MEALNNIIKRARNFWMWLPVAALLAGCTSPGMRGYYGPIPDSNAGAGAGADSMGADMGDTTNYTLRVGDTLTVNFLDVNPPIPAVMDQVQEDGSITLIQSQRFQAAGMTVGALRTAIHDRYVPAFYTYMSINIVPGNRAFSVEGEVRAPNKYAYTGQTTLLEAIATAGGFTDYARKRSVLVTRAKDRRQITVNCVQAIDKPELNIEIFPGDRIYVRHTIF